VYITLYTLIQLYSRDKLSRNICVLATYFAGFFVKRGHFDQKFVKKGRLNFFLQNRVKSSWWRTTLKVKSSSTVPVSFLFFQKVKPCSQKPVSIYF